MTVVVMCFSCKLFQAHQKRKDNKFNCKICNIKQSIKKIYYDGDGKSCRIHLQQLNLEMNQANETVMSDCPEADEMMSTEPQCSVKTHYKSKWEEFLEEDSGEQTSLMEKAEIKDVSNTKQPDFTKIGSHSEPCNNASLQIKLLEEKKLQGKYDFDEEIEDLLASEFGSN